MAIRSTVRTIGTTPLLLAAQDDQDGNPTYRDIAIQNSGDITVYLGGPDVTPSNGFPLLAGASLSVDRASGTDLLYAVSTEATELAVLELGV